MESDHSGIEKYINLVRKRAYASNWDENKHGYKSGDFTQNELAILHEKDKEFCSRRATLVGRVTHDSDKRR